MPEAPALAPATPAAPAPSGAPRTACAFRPMLKKEVRAYFNAPAAYIVTLVFVLIAGYLFAQPLFLANLSSLDSFTDLAPLLLVFFIPAVTMRLFSEEHKSGTIEIVSTLPVGDAAVIGAKYAAALCVLAFALLATLPYPATIAVLGRLDWGAAAGAYLGLFLTGALFSAIGLFASSMTRNQINAFLTAFLPGFAFYLIGKTDTWTPAPLLPLTSFLGIDAHLENLSRGILDSRDLLYFASTAGFFLFLTRLGVESRRK